MAMGTIKVKTPEGEERDVEVADLLRERRSGQASFQVKTLWAVGSSTIGFLLIWLFTTGAGEKLRKIDEHEMKIQQLQVSLAEKSAVQEVKYNHIITALADIKMQMERQERR